MKYTSELCLLFSVAISLACVHNCVCVSADVPTPKMIQFQIQSLGGRNHSFQTYARTKLARHTVNSIACSGILRNVLRSFTWRRSTLLRRLAPALNTADGRQFLTQRTGLRCMELESSICHTNSDISTDRSADGCSQGSPSVRISAIYYGVCNKFARQRAKGH